MMLPRVAFDLLGGYARQPKTRQQKTVEHVVGVAVASYDVAVRADGSGPGKGSAGIIESVEFSPAQQIGMRDAVDRIPSHHLTAGIDIDHVREGSGAGGVD